MLNAVALALLLSASQGPVGPFPERVEVQKREPLRVLVPAYFYPVPGSPWTRLNAAAAAHPGRIAAIGNPGSGPGTFQDSTYVATFASFRASGGALLGYVYSSYGNRPIALVKADINQWFAWYPLDGIFVDEMDNTPGAHESYYRELFVHVRSHLATARVVGNPGVGAPPSYLFFNGQRVASTLCIYEHSTGFSSWSADPWVFGYPRANFYVLPYGMQASGWQAAVDRAYANNVGWIFVTDDVLPNPWDTLPSYFETMNAYIAANY